MTVDGKQLKAATVASTALATAVQTVINRLNVVLSSTGFSDPGNTSNFDFPSLQVALPRAGTYHFEFIAQLQATVNPTTVGMGITFTGTTTTLLAIAENPSSGSGIAFYVPQTTSGSLGTSAVGTANSRACRCTGFITVSTTGTLKLQMNRSANAISSTGGCGRVVEQ